jgi:hypothetical protein
MTALIYVTSLLAVVSLVITFPPGYPLEFNEKDYYINNFGIKNGNPFMTVQGTAGGSYDPSMGDEGYEAYVFDTDKGIFQISVGQGTANEGTPFYSTYHTTSNSTGEGQCFQKEATDAKANFDNHTATYIDHNLNIKKSIKYLPF